MTTKTYLTNFFEEKEIAYQMFEIEHKGQVHIIDTDAIIEVIKSTVGREAEAIRMTLTKIDFMNGNVGHFLKHLATGYVKVNY